VTTQQECINVSQTISMTINTDGTTSRSIYNCKINDILDQFPWPFWLIMHYIIICNNKSYWEYNLVSRLPKNWGSSHSISPGISRWIVKCLMLIQLYSIREYPFINIIKKVNMSYCAQTWQPFKWRRQLHQINEATN
jgi:hypothetical protein